MNFRLMDLGAYRRDRGLSLKQVAEALDLRSEGYVSMLERGARFAPLPVALQIEDWSQGHVNALTLLNPDNKRLLDAHHRHQSRRNIERLAAA